MSQQEQVASKFWDADESESSSSSSDSDSEPEQKAPQQQAGKSGRAPMGRWAEESSSEDEKPQRIAPRSHTDKRYAQIKEIVKQMKNHIKIDDFSSLLTDYSSLVTNTEKLKNFTGGQNNDGNPGFFIKALALLDGFVKKHHEEGSTKTMTKNKARQFQTLRAKLRKGNQVYEDDLTRYEEHPSEFEDDEADDEAEASGDDDSSDSSSAASSDAEDDDGKDKGDSDDSDSTSSKSSGSDSDDESGSDDSSWDESESSDSDEDMDEEERRRKRMQKWLKTESDYEEERKEQEKRLAAIKIRDDRKAQKEAAMQAGKKVADKDNRKMSTVEQKDENLTFDELTQKIQLIHQMRGRKGVDKNASLIQLEDYFTRLDKFLTGESPAMNWKITILASLNAFEFDHASGAFSAIRPESWETILNNLHRILDLFGTWEDPEKEDAELEKAVCYTTLMTNLIHSLERLDDELYKGLQFSGDATTPEFQSQLAHAPKLIRILVRGIKFVETRPGYEEEVGKLSIRLMEQLYFKHDDVNKKIYELIQEQAPESEKAQWVWPADSCAMMEKLRRNVYLVQSARSRLRAIMCEVYHLALHNHYRKARNLFHFSNIAERAAEMNTDVNTQILYNHVLAQMGLCAFRAMMIPEAHNALVELCMYMKTKELLAQGMSYSRFQERNPDQEKLEKKRQVPYPMHIDLDFLESVHLISAMLLEIPHMAHQHLDPTKQKEKPISRLLNRHLHSQTLPTGQTPPENARETVVAAARFLKKSDWQSCIEMLDKLRFWNNMQDPEPVRKLLYEKIKVEALRTFMFYSLTSYDAFHLDQLEQFFALPKKTVHSTLSKMIIFNEIPASWDSTSEYVVVQRSDLTTLHKLSLQLADKIQQTLENNERSLDIKCGTKEAQQKGMQMQRGQWDQQGQGKRGYNTGGGKGRVFVVDDQQRSKGKGGKGGQNRGGGKGGQKGGGGQNRGGWGSDNRGQQQSSGFGNSSGFGQSNRGRWNNQPNRQWSQSSGAW